MGCLSWVIQQKMTTTYQECIALQQISNKISSQKHTSIPRVPLYDVNGETGIESVWPWGQLALLVITHQEIHAINSHCNSNLSLIHHRFRPECQNGILRYKDLWIRRMGWTSLWLTDDWLNRYIFVIAGSVQNIIQRTMIKRWLLIEKHRNNDILHVD